MIEALADAAREHLAAGRPLVTVVSGHSMWPAIADGDRVTLLPLDGPPRVGDVVLVDLALPGDRAALVLHRVVAIAPDGRLIVKGDAVAAPDPHVPPTRVLGRLDRPGSPLAACLSRLAGALGARLLQAARRRLYADPGAR